MKLKGQCAIVTGASRGIGRAICLALSSEGADIAVNDLPDAVGAHETSRLCEVSHVRASVFAADISDYDQCQELAANVLRTFGRIDILVNNAGVLRDKTLRNLTREDWELVLRVNLSGCFNMCKAIEETMRLCNYGRIINISSVIAHTGNFGQTNYAASKAGILGFTRSLAREMAKHNITVNTVAPGLVDTDMTRTIPEEYRRKILENIPVGRAQTPEEIANAVVFLASPEQKSITGECINVNGGWYMG